jgi:hypothetical protein
LNDRTAGASKDRDERAQRKDANKNAAIRWILERVTDDELKSSATDDAEEDMGDYTIPSLGRGRGTCMSASGAADHAVAEHEAIMQFETGRLTVPSYRRRNRKRLPSFRAIGGQVSVLTVSVLKYHTASKSTCASASAKLKHGVQKASM